MAEVGAWFEQARAGDRRALGRLLSQVERGGAAARAIGQLAFPASAGVDQILGITGAPGSGKSTLTSRLISELRAAGRTVGVVAIDPSSPFTGGALLGDRVRMQEHSGDAGVFIRSMANRGHLGGLALAVPEAVRLLAAVGYGTVIVETVGVGQVEVEVAGYADTTVVVVTPGWGDAVQAGKAGLLEVADMFVVNKADQPGAEATRRDLAAMLDLNSDSVAWRPPIVLTNATEGGGAAEVGKEIARHGEYLRESGERGTRRRQHLLAEFSSVVVRQLEAGVRSLNGGASYADAAAAVGEYRVDPYQAAAELVAAAGAGRYGRDDAEPLRPDRTPP